MRHDKRRRRRPDGMEDLVEEMVECWMILELGCDMRRRRVRTIVLREFKARAEALIDPDNASVRRSKAMLGRIVTQHYKGSRRGEA